jgi:SUMO ligase MMS21 Smc5/6 complex component
MFTGKVKTVICPMAGCAAKISMEDIAVDPRLSARIARLRKWQDKDWENINF